MSNAPEGRTYIDYCWDVREGASAHFNVRAWQRAHSIKKDVVEVQTPYVVPNGRWVMERPAGYSLTRLVGITHDEVATHEYTDKHHVRHCLYISNKPFGFVAAEDEDVDRDMSPAVVKPTGRKRLFCAQQVHKGELGRTVSIPPLPYVRQPFEEGQKPSVTKAHQRRRGYGWVMVRDLGEIAKDASYNPETWAELVLGYWQFSGHLIYDLAGRRAGTLVDTIWGNRYEIRAGKAEVVSMTPEQFWEDASFDSTQLWIRRGFAYTILRLQALGVAPNVLQHA